MILQSLYELYDRLSHDPDNPIAHRATACRKSHSESYLHRMEDYTRSRACAINIVKGLVK
jgi:hypothetical protein